MLPAFKYCGPTQPSQAENCQLTSHFPKESDTLFGRAAKTQLAHDEMFFPERNIFSLFHDKIRQGIFWLNHGWYV